MYVRSVRLVRFLAYCVFLGLLRFITINVYNSV